MSEEPGKYSALQEALVLALLQTQGRYDSQQERAAAMMKLLEPALAVLVQEEAAQATLPWGVV